MRTWVKVSIAGVAVVVLGMAALAGTGAYLVSRHLDIHSAAEADARREFEAIRSRFGGRAPLVEITDLQSGNVRVNRPAQPDGRPIRTFHLLTWKAEDDEVFATEGPIWLMRFSALNVLSNLGVAPERFRLTVKDVERYGPGIVVDYNRPGQSRALMWVD